MSIGERIRYFRRYTGITQQSLGDIMGFSQKTADVRINQYEAGGRIPKADVIQAIADFFEVSPNALSVPNIDDCVRVMHTFFALEDIYGLRVSEADGEVCLKIDLKHENEDRKLPEHAAIELYTMMRRWKAEAMKLEKGEISKTLYDEWRYNFPKYDCEDM